MCRLTSSILHAMSYLAQMQDLRMHAAAVSDEAPMPVHNTLAELHCCMTETRNIQSASINALRLFHCTQDANTELPTFWLDVVHMARVLSMACVLRC